MQLTRTSSGFDATVTKYNAYGREKSVDEYLCVALKEISDAYKNDFCPVIIFDLWSLSRLLVFDSPSGLELNRAERVYTQLTHNLFTSYCEGYIDAVRTEHGDHSVEYSNAELTLVNLTLDSARKSLQSGEAREHLDNFDPAPKLVMIVEGNDSLAHDLLTGDRVAMHGHSIDGEDMDFCQCRYCQNNMS